MKKRIFAILIALVVAVGLFPIHAYATDEHEHDYEFGFETLENGQHGYICECGQMLIEDCVFEYYMYDETEHWTECNHCMNWIDRETHTIEDCECTDEHCGYMEHIVESWEISTINPQQHTGYCSACERDITIEHDWGWAYSESFHWTECVCGYKTELDKDEHDLTDWAPHSVNRHFRSCGCGYMVVETHVDADGDLICDIESCGEEIHPDSDVNHVCDDCGMILNTFCVDDEEDHICDVVTCRVGMNWVCFDNDGDHICDLLSCDRYMQEYCEDENGDYICDVCGQNSCCHNVLNDITSNGDGTHSALCEFCGLLLVEECDAYDVLFCGTEGHGYVCCCDYEFPPEAHTYEDGWYTGAYSVVGHWVECDGCSYERLEAHTGSNGVCEICEQSIVELFDVYVGGVGLENGQYLDAEGNVSADKPEGGYAYYLDGVLELNGFTYEGSGFVWQESDDYKYHAAIFASRDLVLILTGENQISSYVTDVDEDIYIYADGVAGYGNLTVRGEGSLMVYAMDDGVDVENGDFIMESGTLILGFVEYNEDGSVKGYEKIGDDGIDADSGDVLISGGTLHIVADDHGVDTVGDVVITGGVINILAGDDGIESNKSVTISGCKLDINAVDEMIIGTRVSISTIEIGADEDDAQGSTADNETQDASGSNETSQPENDTSDIASKTKEESDGLSTGAIVGITIGSVVIVELGVGAIVWFLLKKKKLADLI